MVKEQHVCACNEFSCRCQELVTYSGEICDMCKDGVHRFADDEPEIDLDHDFDTID